MLNVNTFVVKQPSNSAVILNRKTLNDFVNFLDVSEITARAYIFGLKKFSEFINVNGVINPTREHVLEFKRYLISKGLKASSIALYMAGIRRFFQWLNDANIYPDITIGVKAPKQEVGHKRDFLGATQLKAVLSSVKADNLIAKRNFAILSLMATGGLRTIEITRANVGDIQTIGGVYVLYVQGKGRNDKKEFVKLSQPVLNAINEYLKLRGQALDNEPLFISTSNRNKNGRLSTRSISGIAKEAMKKAGYNSKRLTAHSFRHAAITLALMAGESLSEVQCFARHRNINTTQIYAHNVDRLKSNCELSISNAIFC